MNFATYSAPMHLGSGIAVVIAAASVVLASATAVDAIDFALRPSFSTDVHIRVEPNDSATSDFFALIKSGIQHADSVKAAAARWHAEHYGSIAADGALLPTLAIYGEGGVANGPPGQNSPYSYGVRVSLPIFDGNRRGFASDAQWATSEAARFAALDELTASLVDLVAAAASLRRADETLRIRQEQRSRAQYLLTATIGERHAGAASKVDTDQAQAQLDQIEIELKLAESARTAAKEAFVAITGQDPGRVGSIGSIASFLPSDVETAVAIALAENPLLHNRLELANAALFAHQSEAATLGPRLNLEMSVGGSGDFVAATSDPIEARALLRFELPFSFGADAQVQRKAMERQAADFEASAATKGVIAAIESAFIRLRAVRSALARARDAEASTAAVVRGMEVERQLGERSLLDVVNAHSANSSAKVRIAELRYELILAEHLLAAQIGRLDDLYGVSLDSAK